MADLKIFKFIYCYQHFHLCWWRSKAEAKPSWGTADITTKWASPPTYKKI